MVFTLAMMIVSAVVGGTFGAGGWAAFKAKAEAAASAEIATLKSDVLAEIAKASPDLATLKAKVTALLAKL
jgi:outer membrane murein-binding lipoprotein Lpp